MYSSNAIEVNEISFEVLTALKNCIKQINSIVSVLLPVFIVLFFLLKKALIKLCCLLTDETESVNMIGSSKCYCFSVL